MKIWQHTIIILVCAVCLFSVTIIYGIYCGLTFGPHELLCPYSKIIEVLAYCPFPLKQFDGQVSSGVSLLLFFLNHIFAVSIVYLIIMWGYHYLKKTRITS